MVVDTSAWIEWLLDSPAGRQLSAHVPPLKDVVVPTIVQFEVAGWGHRNGRPDDLDTLLATFEECVIVALTTDIALSAAQIRAQTKLPAVDSIIYATALATRSRLLTCDAHFAGLPEVVLVPKAPIPDPAG